MPKKKRQRPEQVLQKAVFQHIRNRGVRGLIAFHVPNGGYRPPVEAAILKGLGVKPGVSDIIALYQGRFFALELKARTGRMTAEQMQFVSDVNAAGGFACTARGLDQALKVLETWGLLRGQAI